MLQMQWKIICKKSLQKNKKVSQKIFENMDAILPNKLYNDVKKTLPSKEINITNLFLHLKAEWLHVMSTEDEQQQVIQFVSENLQEFNFDLEEKCDSSKREQLYQLVLRQNHDFKSVKTQKECVYNAGNCTKNQKVKDYSFDPVKEELTLKHSLLWPLISSGVSLDFLLTKYWQKIEKFMRTSGNETSKFYSGVTIKNLQVCVVFYWLVG